MAECGCMYCAQQECFIMKEIEIVLLSVSFLSGERIFESVRGGGGMNVYFVLCFRTYDAQGSNFPFDYNFIKTEAQETIKVAREWTMGRPIKKGDMHL